MTIADVLCLIEAVYQAGMRDAQNPRERRALRHFRLYLFANAEELRRISTDEGCRPNWLRMKHPKPGAGRAVIRQAEQITQALADSGLPIRLPVRAAA